ncbi:MAG TPA: hypothetical protein VJV05_03460 [Pyrinomonadaceae bacterium]|nr:hypothetical protein [Pyrinomonadaceae bacterium]
MPQETNMAELLRLMKNMIVKVDDFALDMKNVIVKVDDLALDMKELKTRTMRVEAKVDRLEAKTDSIAGTVVTNDRRVTAVEHDVSDLKSREN